MSFENNNMKIQNENIKKKYPKIEKPFLKWVGGKTQIITNIINKFPVEINNYHEIFLGGGSVLLAVLIMRREKLITIKNKIYAYDINNTLINTFTHIQRNKDELFYYITKYIKEYDSIKGTVINRKPTNIKEALTSKESYYYWIRDKFNKMNKTNVESSAIFMFLNKTCFRGLYREGPNGFNVPYGHYKKTPVIITKDRLDFISDLIKDVVFIKNDFTNSIKNIKPYDFVYLDPPYVPEIKKSFVSYTKHGFTLESHKELFNRILDMDKKNIKFVMSNANVEIVIKRFKNFNVEKVLARRAINSKNPESQTTELIIYN